MRFFSNQTNPLSSPQDRRFSRGKIAGIKWRWLVQTRGIKICGGTYVKTITKQQYGRQVQAASPDSPVVKDCLLAFLFGGFICTVGQVLCRMYQNLGLELPDARMAVSVSLILISASLTALGWYDNIAKHAGAGTLVPITGFANSMVSPAMEFKSEGFIIGLGAKMFAVSGPVLVFGITASVVYGLIVFLFGL